MPKVFSTAQVAARKSRDDICVVHKNRVYNVTNFVTAHPGGEEVILELGGQDITEAFQEVGHSEDAKKQLEEHFIGVLDKASTTAQVPLDSARSSNRSQGSNSTLLYILGAIAFGAVGYGAYHLGLQ